VINKSTKQQQGIQSIEVGTQLLRVMADNGRPMMLRDLAKSAGMPSAKAHRYLVSFIRMGLIEQDANNGRYDLGEFSLELGLASLARIDSVRLATPILEELCETIGESVSLTRWHKNGVTCVSSVEASSPITIFLRPGVILPLTTTAAGLTFAAFCRSSSLKTMLGKELRVAAKMSNRTLTIAKCDLEEQLNKIKKHGVSLASGSFFEGLNGVSAPVFDHSGRMVAAITAGGSITRIPMKWDSSFALNVKESAAKLSRLLGYGHPGIRGNS
jgi:DNA-binding IclR family transcriptional regulator